jgi:peroxiredoxin
MIKFKLVLIGITGMLLFGQTAVAQNNDYLNALKDCSAQSMLSAANPGCMNGIAAPNFMAQTVDGKTIRLGSLKGKVVVLNFWFIECVPCRMEMPALNETVRKFAKDGVIFLSIAREDRASVRNFLASHPFSFNPIPDPEAAICKNIYHLYAYPTTVVINGNGVIKAFITGGRSNKTDAARDVKERLEPIIRKVLNKG